MLNPGGLGGATPPSDTYETTFLANGQRNIFRQGPQRRADLSIVKLTPIGGRMKLRYTFDIFNLTNTTSFDVPGNNVTQNASYDNFPIEGTPALANASGQRLKPSFFPLARAKPESARDQNPGNA